MIRLHEKAQAFFEIFQHQYSFFGCLDTFGQSFVFKITNARAMYSAVKLFLIIRDENLSWIRVILRLTCFSLAGILVTLSPEYNKKSCNWRKRSGIRSGQRLLYIQYFFLIEENWIWVMTRHHANNILLTRNLSFDSDVRQ